MAKVKKVSKIRQIAVKLAALSISAAAFAVWHTGEAALLCLLSPILWWSGY